ncbi:MAG: hypothetical protein AAFP90_21070 [Planctomycetota bacterium]
MSSAQQYFPNYTVADCQHWEGGWELWRENPIAKTPSPFGVHQRFAKNLVFDRSRG